MSCQTRPIWRVLFLFVSCRALPCLLRSTSPHSLGVQTIMLVTSASGREQRQKGARKGVGHTSTHTREDVRQRSRARARGGEKERRRLTPGPRQGLPSWLPLRARRRWERAVAPRLQPSKFATNVATLHLHQPLQHVNHQISITQLGNLHQHAHHTQGS
jgi:hypothetical protein